MQKKLKIQKGDIVEVIAGASKSQQGKVLEIIRKTDRVVVEGVNMISKHVKPNAQNPQGGIVKTEAPVHISNVMLVVDGQKSRVGRRRNEEGKLVRYSKKSDKEI